MPESMSSLEPHNRQAEVDSSLTRRHYQLLAENINDAIFALNEDGCFSYINHAIERLTAFGVEEVLGREFTFCAHPEDVPQLITELMHNLKGDPRPFEFRIVTKDGSVRYISASSKPYYELGRFRGLTGVLSDVTQRKKVEQELAQYREHLEELVTSRTRELERINLKLKEKVEEKSDIEIALRRSEKQFRALAENSPDVIARIDRDFIIRFVNDQVEKQTDMTVESLVGRSLTEIEGPTEAVREIMLEALKQAFETRQPQARQLNFTDKHGQRKHIDWRLQPEIGDDRSCESVISTSRDISELMQAQEQRQLLDSVIEGTAESVVIFDSDGRIQYANAAYRELSGLRSGDRLEGLRILDSDDELIPENIQDHLDAGQAWSGTFAARTQKGFRIQDMTVTPASTPPDETQRFIALSRDVTNEVELEKKLVQAQKMEAIGTLAGGIAHDFNNVLTPIIGYAEMSLAMLDESSPIRRYLENILKAAGRAKEMVRHILTFSRQADENLLPLNIAPIIKETLKLLRSTIPSTIEIKHRLDPDCGAVLADPTHIHQIMMNLCTNAYHAMDQDGGTLSVGLTRVRIDKADALNQLDLVPGDYLRLSVSDTGHGIRPEIVGRIFEPYFTTKEQGKGTGMGLSVVHGIIRRYGGTIHVYSEEGKGSTFTVYLPETATEGGARDSSASTTYPTGTEHILLVDDEPYVVEMLHDMLTSLGYKVTAFSDSKDALNAFCTGLGEFDLMLSDMTMPGLTGQDLAREVLLVKPGFPVILCTGFSELMNEEQARKAGIREYVMKPVVMSELAHTIRRALN